MRTLKDDRTNNLISTAPQRKEGVEAKHFCCRVCDFQYKAGDKIETGRARGNSNRFFNETYTLSKCPACHSLQTQGAVNFADIYRDYPLKKRTLDAFARSGLTNLLKRLKSCGLQNEHTILDYGCGNGIFLKFLESKGFKSLAGYDPYDEAFMAEPSRKTYDCVVANDVIEHCDDPIGMLEHCLTLLKPGGLLYVGTAESDGVDLTDLKPHLMRLHLPFHRNILSEQALHNLGKRFNLAKVSSWKRSYMDTWMPFGNYRFLDELNKVLDHRIDRAFTSDAPKAIMTSPRLLFFAFFGCFFFTTNEPAMAWRIRK